MPVCSSRAAASVLSGAQLRVLSRPAESLAPRIYSIFVHSNIPIFKNGLIIHVCDFILFPPILKTPTNIFLNLRKISSIVSAVKGEKTPQLNEYAC